MSAKGVKEAVIQMDPPELGPLNVKISVTAEQAQVSFNVTNPTVKDALDQSAMRLKEMFAEEGLNLTDVDVSDNSQQQQHNEDGETSAQYSQEDGLQGDDMEVTESVLYSSPYIIDSYI